MLAQDLFTLTGEVGIKYKFQWSQGAADNWNAFSVFCEHLGASLPQSFKTVKQVCNAVAETLASLEKNSVPTPPGFTPTGYHTLWLLRSWVLATR